MKSDREKYSDLVLMLESTAEMAIFQAQLALSLPPGSQEQEKAFQLLENFYVPKCNELVNEMAVIVPTTHLPQKDLAEGKNKMEKCMRRLKAELTSMGEAMNRAHGIAYQ